MNSIKWHAIGLSYDNIIELRNNGIELSNIRIPFGVGECKIGMSYPQIPSVCFTPPPGSPGLYECAEVYYKDSLTKECTFLFDEVYYDNALKKLDEYAKSNLNEVMFGYMCTRNIVISDTTIEKYHKFFTCNIPTLQLNLIPETINIYGKDRNCEDFYVNIILNDGLFFAILSTPIIRRQGLQKTKLIILRHDDRIELVKAIEFIKIFINK
jgi:hypothetical protein